MKRLSRVITVACVSVLSVSALAACGGGSSPAAQDCKPKFEFPTITQGTLTVATFDGMPYFGQADSSQQGIDADFLNAFAADACLKTEWVVSPSAGVIQSVASGRADVAAGGWYATAERGKTVSQSDSTYVELPTIFAKTATSSAKSLAGQTVGTVTGYTWNDELKALGAEVKEYQSADAVLNDLAADRIKFAVLGGIDAPYLLKQNKTYESIVAKIMDPDPAVNSSVNPSLPNYPHTKDNKALTEALNKQIKEYHESGKEVEILKKYNLDPALADTEKFKK
ncbi:substrate-binding periplasmic protein [Paenarthrobacter sp. NPDC058040]|uniref:substrate-binding periplasmic protein n=1 Tax=unclassified Paenarthrobacter TaxID=2634190 RepID=UPI0036DC9DA5